MAFLPVFLLFVLISALTYALLERRARSADWRQRLAQVPAGPPLRKAESTPAAAADLSGGSASHPVGLLSRLRERWGRDSRRRRFNAQIPDTLLLLAAALRAGHSPASAIQMIASEMPAPISEEFAQALSEIRLGLPAASALGRMAERVRSADWDLVVTAVTTQVQTGGNLAEILERISGTIRERVRVEAETETLTAEGRLSAGILILLPPVLALLLAVRSPHYFLPLTSTPLGHLLIGGAISGQIVGTLILRRMLRLEV